MALSTRAARPFVLLPATLGSYVARTTLAAILVVVLAFAVLAFLIDLIEQLRNAATDGLSWLTALELAGLRVPGLLDRIWPFAVLFGAMLAFWRLNRSSELVAVRAAGVSAWQFLAPACLVAALLGAFVVGILNPLNAALAARYERVEAASRGVEPAQVAIFRGGVWLRLVDGEQRYVIHASHLRPGRTLDLSTVTVFVYGLDGTYGHRLDAETAYLADGFWVIEDARRSDGMQIDTPVGEVRIGTDLRADTIRRSFRRPETLSFWELPGYADLIEQLGFSAREHRVHWHSLSATPALFAAMLLVGVTFTLRFRRGGTSKLVPLGLVGGFVFFVLVDVVRALGVSGQLPTVLAAWTPTVVALMLGSAALFQLEDG